MGNELVINNDLEVWVAPDYAVCILSRNFPGRSEKKNVKLQLEESESSRRPGEQCRGLTAWTTVLGLCRQHKLCLQSTKELKNGNVKTYVWVCVYHRYSCDKVNGKSSPITGLDRPTGFQEVEAPRFLDNRYMKVVSCQPYAPAAFTAQEIFLLEAELTPGP
jgi:hypothetical protein